jgi:hypothetical protein
MGFTEEKCFCIEAVVAVKGRLPYLRWKLVDVLYDEGG